MAARFGGAARAALAAGMALAVGTAVAQAAAPKASGAKVAATRHQSFKQVGGAFKAINDQVKSDTPDKAVVLANAQKLHALSGQMPGWFPKGSGPESGAKTHARPQVWSDPQGFAAAMQRMQAATAKLQQTAAAGDMAAVKAQIPAVGGACKGCHDKYRVPDKD